MTFAGTMRKHLRSGCTARNKHPIGLPRVLSTAYLEQQSGQQV